MPRKRAHSDCSSTSDVSSVSPKRARRAHSLDPPSPLSPLLVTTTNARRSRARSLDSKAPILSLTHENLSTHTSLTTANAKLLSNTMPRTPSPSRSSNNGLVIKQQLEAHGIFFDEDPHDCPLPPDLHIHVRDTIRKARCGPPSPNGKSVAAHARWLTMQNEIGAITKLEQFLLFDGEIEGSDGIAGLDKQRQLNLMRCWLPQRPKTSSKSQAPLSMPQPDRLIGYITRQNVKNAPGHVTQPFTEDEEDMALEFRLCERLHFPFLTFQSKSATASETLFNANCQSARDGAAIVNHLHFLYSSAYQSPPSVVATSHLSLTCDMNAIYLWVHWRDDVAGAARYHMQPIGQWLLRVESSIVELRGFLRNIVDWSMETRLNSIKQALPMLNANRSRVQIPSVDDSGILLADSSSATASVPSMPPPLSVTSDVEPTKKRPRHL